MCVTVLLGNQVNGEVTKIEEIVSKNEAVFDVIIEGEVFGVDIRGPFRNGSRLFKGAITDGTNSMYFQFFSPLEIDLKDGMGLRLGGSTEKNQYTRGEYILMVENAIEIEIEKEIRKDLAEKKRVELSVVGNYSQHVSAMTFKEIAKQAKDFGHSAIALTDIGAVQGFPEAFRAAKDNDLKLILGMKVMYVDDEIPIVVNATNHDIYQASYTVYDVETTGFSNMDDELIEIGATKFVNGEVVERFQRFIKPSKPIPEHITELTGITQEEVDDEGTTLKQAVEEFHEFWKGTTLVAHNAQFDIDHLKVAYKRIGMKIPHMVVLDTLQLSRMLNSDMKAHGLNKLAKKYKVNLDSHHRADQDAEATGQVMLHMFEQLKELGLETLQDINDTFMTEEYFKTFFAGNATILVKNKVGLRNLYKIISLSHSDYLGRVPMITKRALNEHREGLLIGSGSFEGRLFDMALNKTPAHVLEEAKFFDYLEVEPTEIASHLVNQTRAESTESIERSWKTIYAAGQKLNKPIIASGYVHYVNKEDRLAQHILIYNERAGMPHHMRRGRMDDLRGYAHFRTTDEMIEGITYLSEEETKKVVVDNTNMIADMCEVVEPLPNKLFPPVVPDANERLKKESIERAIELYGTPIPENVQKRLDKELDSIIGNGFAVIYTISADLVKKSMEDGYLVGSRGSVGSSFVATMSGITEVNPLKPHYNCPSCKWSLFFDHEEVQSGYDLPTRFEELFSLDKFSEEAILYFKESFKNDLGESKTQTLIDGNVKVNTCPNCSHEGIIRDGQDIPFETFLGFKGDKVPDIDLNFSGEYQPVAHKFVGDNKVEFGISGAFRAGTVGTVADKTAFGYTKKYTEEHGISWSNAEVTRVAGKLTGAKRTTGQHPGGMIVVPKGMEMEDFGGFQYPANDKTKPYPTTHYAFEHIHDYLCKLDILGHDDPTILRLLFDSTGINPRQVPPNDEKVLKLFTDPEEALGIPLSKIEADTGTLAVPEFGTEFVQQMVVDTKPKTFAELVKISGLSHGTDVWLNNAQDLILEGTCTLKEVIDTRDNIMVYLMQKGIEPSTAFTIMERVRKGKGLVDPSWEPLMRDHGVPDWYIDSCKKIKYMFPKAHAAAYVLSAMRIAYYKVYYPIHFYAAQLSVRWKDADVTEIIKPPNQIRARLKELYEEIDAKQKTNQPVTNEKEMVNYLKVILEAKERGVEFGNIQVHGSDAHRWTIQDNVIIPPFVSVPGLGDTAADKLLEASKEGIFKGTEDLRARGGITKTVIDTLRGLDCLKLIEAKQHTFF